MDYLVGRDEMWAYRARVEFAGEKMSEQGERGEGDGWMELGGIKIWEIV